MVFGQAVLGQGMLPAWLVVPPAGVVLVVIGAHVLALQVMAIPPARRRIRTASGLLMMFVTALIAYALAILPEPRGGGGSGGTSDARHVFVMVWTLVVGLLAIVVALAAADAAHTLGLAMKSRRELRTQMRERVHEDVRSRGAESEGTPRA